MSSFLNMDFSIFNIYCILVALFLSVGTYIYDKMLCGIHMWYTYMIRCYVEHLTSNSSLGFV
jgi:hypothetical protein